MSGCRERWWAGGWSRTESGLEGCGLIVGEFGERGGRTGESECGPCRYLGSCRDKVSAGLRKWLGYPFLRILAMFLAIFR
jgi:hypothetical protein